MKTSLIHKIILILAVLFLPAVVFAYQIDIAADNLEYDQNCGKISAKGNVVFVWEDRTVSADYVEFIIEEKVMRAYGNVKVDEGGNAVFANSVEYYYDEEKGEINETLGYSAMVFMRSRKMDRIDKNAYSINNITLSTCDLDHPHTYFKAKKGKIVLGERITIYNPILYVGKVPVFYLPIVTKSLKGGSGFSTGLSFTVEPGYTSEGGFSLKTTAAYGFSESMNLKAMLDYFGSRGIGYGGEFNYFTPTARGSIYAYNINDNSTGTERWTVRPYYWQRINNEWTIQSQAEFISDTSFNNYYNQDDWERTLNTLHSYFSLTRQDKNGNLMMLAERYDTYSEDGYEPTMIALPQINYSYYPKKIFFGMTHNFDLTYRNEYREYDPYNNPGNFFYKNTAGLTYNLSKDFRFGRRFTLKPSVGFIENWYDKDNTGITNHNFVTRYLASLNSRLRVNRWMDWNVNYAIRARSAENSLDVDSQNNDYGIETNLLSFTNYMYIGSRTTVRNFVSYSFRDFRYSDPSRWSPFITELTYTPKYYITAYVRQSQLLEPFKFQSMQMDVKIGELEKAYINFGAFYQNYEDASLIYRSHEVDNTFGFGVWLNPKWRLDYNIRTTATLDFKYIRLNDHEFRLYRDLHCYNLGLTWRIRGIYHEVFFKFDLKTNMPFSRQKADEQYREEEDIFYPWR